MFATGGGHQGRWRQGQRFRYVPVEMCACYT